MTVLKTEGIVLQSTLFKDYDYIVQLFTPEGLLKLFMKGKKRFQNHALISPLNVGEYLFTQGKSDLFRFHDGTVLKQNLRIRERLEALETAGKLIYAVLRSQWPPRAAPELYFLFRLLLEKIPTLKCSQPLIPLFLLKVLKHEGVLQLTNHCSACGNPANYRFGGACYCQNHAPQQAISFTSQEEEQLQQIANSRSLKEVASLKVADHFFSHIETLFKHVFIVL
ncbi:MAG: DNA repair protein RecO [Chlamydiales bacterium]